MKGRYAVVHILLWPQNTKENITIMRQLNSLVIGYYGKLKLVPYQLLQSTTLKGLCIYGCPILETRFKKETKEDW